MKFSKLRQFIPVSSIGLVAAALLTACSITTIDYVFVASSTGQSRPSPWTPSPGHCARCPSAVTTGVSSLRSPWP